MQVKIREFENLLRAGQAIDYKRALKAIEVELAFLYEVFFTSNQFLHYYEAKISSFWALASFIGICFVSAAVPGTVVSHHRITLSTRPPDGGTVVVGTTTADLVITFVILVSLAVLQLMQLFRCWTSNWAKVAFACEYAETQSTSGRPIRWRLWMRLKAFLVTRMSWFDKYLWQDKLGQYSLVAANSWREERCRKCLPRNAQSPCLVPYWCYCICDRLPGMLGLQYIGQVLRELLVVSDDVKTSISDFLAQKIKTRRSIGEIWSSLFVDNGLDASYLPYSDVPMREVNRRFIRSDTYTFAYRVMMWHIATWYCEQAEDRQQGTAGRGGEEGRERKNRRVAVVLSKYCAYLVVSAPELLPGPSAETKRALEDAASATNSSMQMARNELAEIQQEPHGYDEISDYQDDAFWMGVYWGKRLRNETPPPPECTRRRSDDPWEVLALLWVQTLLYAAPYGDMQAHLQHLSQGGEFITHLWALLYHIGIDKWEPAGQDIIYV